MQIFVVRVAAFIPYPITREYTEKASDFGTAVRRAMQQYRKEERVKRRKIKQMTVSVARGF